MVAIVSDLHLQDYIDPSKCKLRVKLRQMKEPEGEADDYLALLAELTAIVVTTHRVQLGPVELSKGSFAERIQATKQHIQQGTLAIFKPALEASTEIGGTPCRLQGNPDFLIAAENGGYKIRLCDASRVVTDKSPMEVHTRLKFFSYIYEQSFGKKPAALEIVDGAGNIITVPQAKNQTQSVREDVKNILAALAATDQPYEPVGRSKCILCPFYHRCWPKAADQNDVSLVKGVDQNLAHALHESATSSIAQLLKRFGNDEPGLSSLERRWGFSRKPVGEKSAQTILRFARAMSTGKETLIRQPAIPDSVHFVMFDLEGLPDRLDPDAPIYLWGLQVFSTDGTAGEGFTPAVAPFEANGDEKGWQAFLARAKKIFACYGDIPFIHWDKYERARLDAYIERFGDRDGIGARVRNQLVDLRKEVEESLVLPISSYSLKVIEQYVGYERTQDEFGTNWSIVKFIEARDTADGATRRKTMAQLLKYNQEDLEAMWAVMLWFRQRVSDLSTPKG